MRVKVDFSNLAKGELVSIHGIGYVKNGSELDLDTDAVEVYKAINGLEKAPAKLVFGDGGEDPVHKKAQKEFEVDAVRSSGVTVLPNDPPPVVKSVPEARRDAGDTSSDAEEK